jgi:phospholipase/carboxylesterase
MIKKGNIKNPEKTVIMLHGRGGNAEDILQFAENLPKNNCYIAVTASNNQWYHNRFTLKTSQNEPHLSESLNKVQELITYAKKYVPTEKVYLLGFSQGACLALEFLARNPLNLGGVFALSGGLIGDDSELQSKHISRTRVFIGCSEFDPFIPLERIFKTKKILEDAGAEVTCITYPGNSHTISEKELDYIKKELKNKQKYNAEFS